ncbi:MAG: poly-gamma-glutamate system protein [Acidobacteriota bacterium]
MPESNASAGDRWSPRSNRVLLPLAAFSLLALFLVEEGRRVVPSPWRDEMLRAAETSADAARALKNHRLERGVFVDPVNDPAETALIGQEYTQITTDRGYLEAKLASTDPNFAAVVVDMLHELEVEPGDCVAVAMTGSFPALNLSALAALETLGTRPVVISSVGASNFGATDPYFTWLDMEQEVARQGILYTRSTAASLGGGNDTGRGLSPKGRELLQQAVQRNGVPLLAAPQLEESIRRRVQLYREVCDPQPIAAFVNVGGGIASLGHSLNANLIPGGASLRLPRRNFPARGSLLRLAEEGAPVIHLLNVRQLRDRYGLSAVIDEAPVPGNGAVYGQVRYSVVQTLLLTGLLVATLVALLIFDQRAHRLGGAVASPTPAGSSAHESV